MIAEAEDFREECAAIYSLLKGLSEEDYQRETLFKSWTIYDVLAHLHLWNMAADWTLNDPPKFMALMGKVIEVFQGGKTHQELQREWAEDQGLTKGQALLAAWHEGYQSLADKYVAADPEQRVKWGGPDMSTKSCIIARQMEHWAHAQAIYDVLGKDRQDTDRLKNVAHIGVTTYSWSFKVNGRQPLLPKPYIRLTSPEGNIWEWNEPPNEKDKHDNKLEGPAADFCQVVTQCRNISDVNLTATGENATEWMKIAQCFAGGAETPPAPGSRLKST